MPLVGQGFNSLIGTRVSPVDNKTQEFYNLKTGQGFSDPNALSGFVNQNFAGVNTNPQNVFTTLAGNHAAPTPTDSPAGVSGQINQAPSPTSFNTTPVNLNLPLNFDSSLLASPPKSSLDINKLVQGNVAQRQQFTQQLASALQPSEQEKQLQQQLLGAQTQVRQFGLQAQGLLNPDNQAIALPFLTGQGQNKLINVQLQEQNLQGQLGFAQQARENQVKGIQAQIEAGNANSDDYLKLAQLQRQQEQDYLTRVDRLSDNARLTLNTLITNFGGLAFEDLSPQTQSQLQQLSRLAGVPDGLLRSGLQTIKDKQILQQQQNTIALQQQRDIQNANLQQQRNIQNELATQRLLLAQDRANKGGGGGGSSGSPVASADRNKYGIPEFVNKNEFTSVRNFIRDVVSQVRVNDANRYDLWGKVANKITESGLNPTDFDGLLWEAFSPTGLKGFQAKNKPASGQSSLYDNL